MILQQNRFSSVFNPARWEVVDKNVRYEDLEFNSYVFEINGKAYFGNTPEFKKAFEQEMIWEKLNA